MRAYNGPALQGLKLENNIAKKIEDSMKYFLQHCTCSIVT
jgi:hypothetical protein